MRKNKKKNQEEENENILNALHDGTKRVVVGIVFFVFFLFASLAALHRAGVAGDIFFQFSTLLLGAGYFLLPLLSLAISMRLLLAHHRSFTATQIAGAVLFLFAGFGFLELTVTRGGMVGHFITLPLIKFFDFSISLILLAALLAISVLIFSNGSVIFLPLASLQKILARKKDDRDEAYANQSASLASPRIEKNTNTNEETLEISKSEKTKDATVDKLKGSAVTERKTASFGEPPAGTAKGGAKNDEAGAELSWSSAYTPPPLDLLKGDRGKPSVGDVKANANIIKRTLQNFGISVEMDEISIGPSITRYALKPAEGTKLSRIVGLQDNLALALAAHPVRIEAPIPGKSLVGIEIPNMTKSTVGIGTLIGSSEFLESDKPLFAALGRDISGKAHFGNLARMPHILLAGATNSGKSVAIHAIITSLLYKNSPENLKFIMIDPKRVELPLYNDIPHLQFQVITNAKNALLALVWASKEMSKRYDILGAEQVRDIESYHKNIFLPALKKAVGKTGNTGEKAELDPTMPMRMPYIVIVIDELAAIMQAYPRELEAAIVRLAQMSRAVGIHLVLSTQRPSVNVITGLIKANIPARIALQVTSQIDSRTILDASGAEKLLGAGDMLYLSGEMSKPIRLQSAFISEGELKSVVDYLLQTYEGPPPPDITNYFKNEDSETFFASIGKDTTFEENTDDPLYDSARNIVITSKKASTSLLQRKLSIGYARAARLIDTLEERGVVSAGTGARPRDILVDQEEESTDEELYA